MTVIESSEVPILAQPRRPEGRMGFRQFLRAIRDNALATHKAENFIMAPAFDPHSIAGYAPIMTDVTEALLAKWDGYRRRAKSMWRRR